ncbi:S8 family serine peptidase [Kyrpidia spormannii]|uniref:S8 family serine peptidase n=1 Tax=Kyrpidia spormannii TaxID=2055160 RepID=UPI0014738C1E|nr:S8 family serine peptidase [Kyrpidia spormannii]
MAIAFGGLKGTHLQNEVSVTEVGSNRWILRGKQRDVKRLCQDSGLPYILGNEIHVAGFRSGTLPPQVHTNVLFSLPHGSTNQGIKAMRDLYHVPQNVTGSGSGIALVTIGYPDEGDINRFAKEEGIGYTPLSFFDRPGTGNRVSDPATAVYESVRMIAPQAKIFVYSAADATWAGLTDAMLRALGDTWAEVVVVPWSIEESSVPQPVLAMWHDIFASMREKGVVVIAAAGDRQIFPPAAGRQDYPASDPSVIGVGRATTVPQSLGIWPESGTRVNDHNLPNHQPANGSGPNVARITIPDSGGTFWLSGSPQRVGGSAIAAGMFGGILADLESQGVEPFTSSGALGR